jgi:hypothetical protein
MGAVGMPSFLHDEAARILYKFLKATRGTEKPNCKLLLPVLFSSVTILAARSQGVPLDILSLARQVQPVLSNTKRNRSVYRVRGLLIRKAQVVARLAGAPMHNGQVPLRATVESIGARLGLSPEVRGIAFRHITAAKAACAEGRCSHTDNRHADRNTRDDLMVAAALYLATRRVKDPKPQRVFAGAVGACDATLRRFVKLLNPDFTYSVIRPRQRKMDPPSSEDKTIVSDLDSDRPSGA